MDKLTAITYPSGTKVNYSFDAQGYLTAISVNPVNANGVGTGTLTSPLLSALGYNAENKLSGWLWADGKARTIAYDSVGMVSSYTLGDPLGSGAAAGALRSVNRDAAGRITGYSHVNNGLAVTGQDQSFGYDNLNRLLSASLAGSGISTLYSYDETGNRTSKTVGASTYSNTVSPTSNRLTQTQDVLGTATIQYDAAGHITSDGANSFTYTDRGRMSSAVTVGGTVNYLYNGLNQRVGKSGPTAVVPTGAAYYVYDEAGQLLGEYDAAGAPIYETIYLGSLPVGVMKQTGSAAGSDIAVNLYNLHADHIATPRVITRQDETIVWRWDTAEAFGGTAPEQDPSGLGAFVFNQRFPGQVFDAETGLFQNWNREYNARLGRYIQSDPIGLRGGINTFAYVGGNPLSYTDPMGLARILKPDFKSFNDGVQWAKKYQDLFDQNNSMRERIKKNCPQLLQKFDDWTISLDPNIDGGYGKRAGGMYAKTTYSTQSSQFNWSFFNRQFGDPSAAEIFAHEFRHLMDANNNLVRPGDGLRDPKKTPSEMDADAWATKFWSEQCDCK